MKTSTCCFLLHIVTDQRAWRLVAGAVLSDDFSIFYCILEVRFLD